VPAILHISRNFK